MTHPILLVLINHKNDNRIKLAFPVLLVLPKFTSNNQKVYHTSVKYRACHRDNNTDIIYINEMDMQKTSSKYCILMEYHPNTHIIITHYCRLEEKRCNEVNVLDDSNDHHSENLKWNIYRNFTHL